MARFFFTIGIATVLFGAVTLPALASRHNTPGGTTSETELGNIVHGRNTQFNWFTKGFGVDDVTDVTWPHIMARRIITILFSFLGIVAVILIIYAGFLWLTAGGEEEKAKQATTLLFQAFIGLIIVLAAWVIAYFVIDQLVKAIIKP